MVNIVEPSLKILTDIDSTKVLKLIESCGRTCYQSYENETEDCTSAKKMIAMLIKSGHESVLEHFSISIKILITEIDIIIENITMINNINCFLYLSIFSNAL